jgi:hypothetical protein
MRKPVILITGAGGEIGHGLLARLAGPERPIITLDVAPLDKTLAPLVTREFTGSIMTWNYSIVLAGSRSIACFSPARCSDTRQFRRCRRTRGRRGAEPAGIRAAQGDRTAGRWSSSPFVGRRVRLPDAAAKSRAGRVLDCQ